MLTGSWRRTGMAVPTPSVPGALSKGRKSARMPGSTMVLEALYDYSYQGADGRQVSIHEGERFLLLRKTNADWWQVRRIGVGMKGKPLYVPATYVVEVPVTTLHSPQPFNQSDSSPNCTVKLTPRASLTPCLQTECSMPDKAVCRSMEDLSSKSAFKDISQGETRKKAFFPTLPQSGQQNTSACSTSGRLMVPSSLTGSAVSLPRSRSSSNLPETQPGECAGPGVRVSAVGSPTKSYSQWDVCETGRRHTYSNVQLSAQAYISQGSFVEQHQMRRQLPEPPSPAPGEQPLQKLDLWEQYRDHVSGRSFYVNIITKERSWKPPRRARDHAACKAVEIQAVTLPRGSNHLTLSSGNSPHHRSFCCELGVSLFCKRKKLLLDFAYNTQNADGDWQLSQIMQRAASSDTLHSTSYNMNHAQGVSEAAEYISHSFSMIVSEQLARSSPTDMSSDHTDDQKTTKLMESPSSASFLDSYSMNPEIQKAGLLNKTKIAEGGRKLRKNWNMSWVVLVRNSLMFFKDPKTQSPSSWKPGNSQPESSVDLRGAQLQWANELSSKKNVFKLRTVTGNEFLLQSETDSLIRDWYSTIRRVIDRLDRENPLDNVLLYSLKRSGSVDLLDNSGDEDDSRACYRTSLPRSASNLENSERKRVKSRLKKLIQKRPTLQSLQEKGLIKDQVFGCGLDVLCEREKSTVPRFVKMCTDAVEKRGLDTDGIYRVSGNLAVIQKLRFAVNHERAITTDGRYLFPDDLVQEERLDLEDPQWEDVHVITGALKLFFRELPEPLIPYNLFSHIVETVKLCDYPEKVEQLKLMVNSMPRPNHDTLKFLFRHLRRVMEHSDQNRMTTQNIGIVFGPTLMRLEQDNGNMAVNLVYQNQAVELILSEYDFIFGPDLDGSV
ncbi:rho GTPase-activating protein 15 [Chanos chanos]|uniref:Rho GTPase-activating protein 15 n=1 Tax=Chanos chanos TaxID=29144 RepID=A0A6J2VS78_CHACN|nr:rho GTPase-activating protein 9 [Chanos chanos]